jgi:hypothetical protein
MNSLIQFAMDAAGGMERFESFSTLTASLHHSGFIWSLKQCDGVLTDSKVPRSVRAQSGPLDLHAVTG